MSWDSIEESIHFWNKDNGDNWQSASATDPAVSSDDQAAIMAAIKLLYDHSPTAQAMLEAASARPLGIRIYQAPPSDPGQAAAHPLGLSATIGINVAEAENDYFFNNLGELKQELLPLAIAHELSHELGTVDPSGTSNADRNAPDYNFDGSLSYFPDPSVDNFAGQLHGAVGIEDQVADELAGYDQNFANHHRTSYEKPIFKYSLDSSGNPVISAAYAAYAPDGGFTRGTPVDIVRLAVAQDPPYYDNMDMSSRTDGKSILAFGEAGNDDIAGASGNDFLYGGSGDDSLSGGAGNNYINGGLLGISSATDGIDTAKYGSGRAVVALDGGSGGITQIDDSVLKHSIVVSDNYAPDPTTGGAPYSHGHDDLFSIEKINGVGTLNVSSFDLSNYELTRTAGADPDRPILWVLGTSSSVLNYSGGNTKITSYDYAFDGSSNSIYRAIDADYGQGAAHTGLAVKFFTQVNLQGGYDSIKLGAADPITDIKLTGSYDTADLSATAIADSTTVHTDDTGSIVAGAGAMSASSMDAGILEGTLVLPEKWSDYTIVQTGQTAFTLTAKDGSAGTYTTTDIASFQFADGTLSNATVGEKAPTGVGLSLALFSVGVPSSLDLGQLSTMDANTLDKFTYALAGGSDQFFLAEHRSKRRHDARSQVGRRPQLRRLAGGH
ncbi:hypothetical protein [Bradyrhizobium sp. CCBAU 53338]|uniref:calcium-binding protein n=1 Tax=Bradyrhizobium sp. CCBAU 53338 TaxID=1325111 RepID=UPI0027394A2E|nr:hypothetical protein [Bradyrhizobium sp. CCBAU 53338]